MTYVHYDIYLTLSNRGYIPHDDGKWVEYATMRNTPRGGYEFAPHVVMRLTNLEKTQRSIDRFEGLLWWLIETLLCRCIQY